MATNEEPKLNNDEPKIPVFTVLKNGAILKNIFIVNNKSPPSPFSISNLPRSIKFVQESGNPNDQENEEVLTVGRHPDCNIMLTHPSISRFHLQIISNSSLQKLSVIDLSSVHGSWVSEKKIEPWVPTELKEGDTLKIGGSSRAYKLHWIPLSQAYDFENPNIYLYDVSRNKEKGEDYLVSGKENVAEVYQDEIYLQMEDKCTQEIESLEVVETKEEYKGDYEGSYSLLVEDIEMQHLPVESISTPYDDENLGLNVKDVVQSAPLMPENPIYTLFDENDSDSQLKEFGEQNETASICAGSSEVKSVNFILPDVEYISETGSLESDKENECLQHRFVTDMVPENSTRGLENESNPFMDLGSFSIEKEEGNCAGEYILETESPECDVGSQFLLSHGVANMDSEIREFARADNESNFIVNLDSLSSIRHKEEDHCDAELAVPSGGESLNSLLSVEEYISETPSPECDFENQCLQAHSMADNMVCEVSEAELPEGETKSNLLVNFTPLKEEADSAAGLAVGSIGSLFSPVTKVLEKHMACDIKLPKGENESSFHVNLDSLSSIEQREKTDCASEPIGSLFSPVTEVLEESEAQKVDKQNQSIEPLNRFQYLSQEAKQDSSLPEEKLCSPFNFNSIVSYGGGHPAAENYEGIEDEIGSLIKSDTGSSFPNIWSRRGKAANVLQIQTGKSRRNIVAGLDMEVKNCSNEDTEDKFNLNKNLSSLDAEEVEIFTPDKENLTPNTLLQKSLKKNSTRSKTSSSKVIFNHNIQSKDAGLDMEVKNCSNEDTEDKFNLNKNLSSLDAEEVEIFTPDKENLTPNTLLQKSLKKNSTRSKTSSSKVIFNHNIQSKDAGLDMEVKNCSNEDTEDKFNLNKNLSSLDVEEVEIFTPDKENLTPNKLLQKSLKKNSTRSKTSSSKVIFNHNIQSKDDFRGPCGKEKKMLIGLQEQKLHLEKRMPFGDLALDEQGKKKRPERVPFQSLIANSADKLDNFGPDTYTRRNAFTKFAQTYEKNNLVQERNNKSWTMVVDTDSLLNKESRKSLQLLQGLKGTHLIIPRMVIRELDCMKRKGSLFRRKTEASLVLEWIQECLVKTSWWIHVQSSGEDRRLTAPTPPASPQSLHNSNSGHFCYGTATNSMVFSGHWSSLEILSPTVEDHILDCAVLCRKMKSDGRLVLLSNDVTLKIKAMTEGLLCETVQEFRESLVNPFSERFLWADSSPRGLTWSYLDDAMLREKYNNRCPFRKSSNAESAKGLKLILLHNSHYRQIPAKAT